MAPFEIPTEHARGIVVLLSSYPSGPDQRFRNRFF